MNILNRDKNHLHIAVTKHKLLVCISSDFAKREQPKNGQIKLNKIVSKVRSFSDALRRSLFILLICERALQLHR